MLAVTILIVRWRVEVAFDAFHLRPSRTTFLPFLLLEENFGW